MIIAVDIGNTNIVLGVIEKGAIRYQARLSSDPKKTVDEYAVLIRELLDSSTEEKIFLEGSIISSVVPPLSATIQHAILRIVGKRPLMVNNELDIGFSLLIENPNELGSDLKAATAAGIEEYKEPLIIFDMGTASTLCVVDRNRNYLGGLIIPGVKLGLEVLSEHASQLPHINLENEDNTSIIGKNTVEGMRKGVIIGHAAMVDGLIDRVEEEVGETLRVVATGGLASIIVPHCRHSIIHDQDLLLKGLYYLYERNKGCGHSSYNLSVQEKF